jgi:hypothetical protein
MIIKIGEHYVNPKYITSVTDEPHFEYKNPSTVGRFIIYTLRNDEAIYVPYSIMPFTTFITEWSQGT